MGLNFIYAEGQTPLDEEEKEGLLISTITSRKDLDEFEQLNIEKAVEWSIKRRWKAEKIFTAAFIKQLHQQMYGDVWLWAGQFRRSNKNIGVDFSQIPVALHNLLADVQFWIREKTYPEKEIAIRFKHKLVAIHCFPNGNGRHSRLIADIINDQVFKSGVYNWGVSNLVSSGDLRNTYIKALKAADCGNLIPLFEFVERA